MNKKQLLTFTLTFLTCVSSVAIASAFDGKQTTGVELSRTTTPREWQERFWALRTKTQTIIVHGAGQFVRTNDDLDLRQYKPSETAFWCLHDVTKQTRVIVLPYGTFVKTVPIVHN